tara:strand:- start:3311 stop:4321 length:1011 start_codon:yes stop_codon:yes gene_type:complete
MKKVNSAAGIDRRTVLKAGAALAGALAMPGLLRARGTPTIRVGYWPISACLPYYVAIEKGFFDQAGLKVEVQRYAGAQQITEAMLAGRCDGCANGTGTANQAIGELAQPGLLKFFCSNPTNARNVLDEIIVGADNDAKTIADLSGKRVAGGPGIQNMTLARTVFERAGAKDVEVVELPFNQHVPSIVAGHIDAAYTLEPQGTIGRLNGSTRVLETGVIAHYILGDPMAPWHGGAASLTSQFLADYPDESTAFIEAYRKGVAYVRDNPDDARQYLDGYSWVKGDLAREVPISGYTMYDEFTPESIQYFQDFFDLFSEAGIFSSPLQVAPMIYAGSAA